MLRAPDALFRRGAALAAAAGVGAFRLRVGLDAWVVVTDERWTAAFARLGPDDADPFEFRLRMPSLRVPGVRPPRDVEASAKVSRESLARICIPDALSARNDALVEAARRRIAHETAAGDELPDAFGFLLRACVDMTSAALFGPEGAATLPASLADDYRAIERALTTQDLFLPRVLSPRAWTAEPARRRIGRALGALVADAARPGGHGSALVRELLDGAAERGVVGAAAAEEVAWTLNSIHWAAHRYPAVHAFWIGVELQQRPELLARVLEEQRGIATLDDAGIEEMELLRGCVCESLRLHPLVALPRRLKRPVVIEGHTLAAGEVIALSPYLAHHDATRLADADRFDPDRWTSEGQGVPRGAFIPGGAGRWACVGMRMTLHMLTVLWASLLRSRRWELLDPIPTYRHGPIITPPSFDLRVRLARAKPVSDGRPSRQSLHPPRVSYERMCEALAPPDAE